MASLLTIQQVCDRLLVDRKTLRAISASGELPRIVLGRRSIRYDPDDVRAFEEGRKQWGSTSEGASTGMSFGKRASDTAPRPAVRRSVRQKTSSAKPAELPVWEQALRHGLP